MRLFQFLIFGKTALGRGQDNIGTFNQIANYENFDPNDYPYDISDLARGQHKPDLPKTDTSKPDMPEPVQEKPIQEHKKADISEFIRGWHKAEVCLAVDNIAGPIENGKVECNGQHCHVKCDPNYHFYGGPPRVRCKKSQWKGPHWSGKHAVCRTCDPIEINDDSMRKKMQDPGQWSETLYHVVRERCWNSSDQQKTGNHSV